MRLIYILTAFICAIQCLNSQEIDNESNANQIIIKDFDNDSLVDTLRIIRDEKSAILEYSLSSEGFKIVKSRNIEFIGDYLSLKLLTNNDVQLENSYMRASYFYTFKYNFNEKYFRLISYENTQFGNATNSGAGTSTWDLVKGSYEAKWSYFNEKTLKLKQCKPVNKRIKFKIIKLEEFGDSIIDDIQQAEYKLLPKELK
jgi:hypothetical protein